VRSKRGENKSTQALLDRGANVNKGSDFNQGLRSPGFPSDPGKGGVFRGCRTGISALLGGDPPDTPATLRVATGNPGGRGVWRPK